MHDMKVSALGQCNNFMPTLVTRRYCPFQSLYAAPLPLTLLEAPLELPFHDAVQHRLCLRLNLCNILEYSSL